MRRLAIGTIALMLVASIVVALQARGTQGLTGWRMPVANTSTMPDPRSPVERQLETLLAQLQRNPNDVRALGQLGQIYVQRARETGDPSYYPRAETAFKEALARDSRNLVAHVGLGSLALSRHDFRGALEWGERARAISPQTAAVLGVIADAQTELGMYPEAVATIQQMVNLRPDLASYSRVSYARELHGKTTGAIEMMQRAVNAGAPGEEGT